MKKSKKIRILKWLPMIIPLLVVLVGYAYAALQSTGDVVVEECLSFVGSSTFAVNVYPQESVIAHVTVANASSLPIDVALTSEIIPDPGAKGMDIDIPATITVPATGQVIVDVTITAGKSAEPITYAVNIDFDR